MVLDQKWVVNSISDVKIEFRHIWSLNATIFESVDKNGFSHFSRALWSFKCDDLLIHFTQAFYHWKVWRLSFHWKKKINVMWPKLIENERNENLKLFHFSKKKSIFFQILKIPWKNSSKSCFFWKVDSTSKPYKIVSKHFQRLLKVSLERYGFTLYDSEALNATISLYAKSSHLKAEKGHF